MKVITAAGSIELGTTEVRPTIGIVDYSRRVTDDFGVTTVVERGFARRMSVRLALPFDQVDAVQQKLADLRATPVEWVADDRFSWLNVTGFYRDFELDLAVPPLSYCTLSVEGLVDTEAAPDAGGDPAPVGSGSTLQLLQPAAVTDAMLTASNVGENDHPEWSAAATYAAGARVIKAATHRIYESLGNGNKGRDPAALTGHWLEVGPTNRWAMFDQALGTSTKATNLITVTIAAGAANAIALLDVTGTLIRVTADGYDRAIAARPGAMKFTDLPPGPVTVRITGAGAISVGTLLVGRLVTLGTTEASPTAGITDFSRKEFDEFGEPIVVPRAWAKRMAAKAIIRTDAIDLVANRIAAVRARPSLWIGDEGTDSLTIYGFFKDFSIEVGENVSTLSLSIEGLAEAPPVVSLPDLLSPPNWADIVDNDPSRPRPQDGADVTGQNTSKDTANIGGTPTASFLAAVAARDAQLDQLDTVTIPEINATVVAADGRIAAARARADAAHSRIDEIVVEDGNGDTDVYARSRIAEIQTQFTEADLVLTERTGLLEAQVGGNPNLLRNPALLTTEGCHYAAYPGTVLRPGYNETWGAYLFVDGLGTGATGIAYVDLEQIGVAQSHWYTAAADFDISGTANASAYIELLWLNPDGVEINGTRVFGPGVERPWFGSSVMTRKAVKASGLAPIGAARLLVRLVFTSGNGAITAIAFRRPKAEQGTVMTPWTSEGLTRQLSARVSTVETALVDGRFATAQRVQSLEATSDAQQTTITQQGTAIADVGRSVGLLTSEVRVGPEPNLFPAGNFANGLQGASFSPGFVAYEGDPSWGNIVFVDTDGQNKYVTWPVQSAHPGAVYSISCEVDRGGSAGGIVGARLIWTINGVQHPTQPIGPVALGPSATVFGVENRRFASGTCPADANGYAVQLLAEGTTGRQHFRRVKVNRGTGYLWSDEAGATQAAASIRQQMGAISAIDGRTGVYWEVVGTTPDGSSRVGLTKANGEPGLFYVEANMLLRGDLVVDGTIDARKFNGASMAREGASVWTGSVTPGAGQTVSVPWSLTLSQIPPTGRFIYEYFATVSTNAGTQTVGTYNGRTLYTNHVQDFGGLTVQAVDQQGNAYRPRANGSDLVRAATDFVPQFTASIRRGGLDTGFVNMGDYYQRDIAATYTVTRIDLRATWVAI